MMSGSTIDSKIKRILSRDKAMPEALRIELLALELCGMALTFLLMRLFVKSS
jgi:hypothetical protein